MIEIVAIHKDDNSFVRLVTQIINGAVKVYKPNEIYVLHIDNWFDHKWHNFAGKTLGAVGVHKSQLTIPPFEPNRVLSQTFYQKDNSGKRIFRSQETKHLHIHQKSEMNLTRYLKNVSDSAFLIWYSGNSENIDVGSVMAYVIQDEMETSWYASFQKNCGWQLNKVQGLSKQEFQGLIQS